MLRRAILPSFMVLAACQTAPAVAQQTQPRTTRPTYYLFTYRPGPAWREGVPMAQQGLAAHGGYMSQLLEQGTLVAGGGFTDRDGGMAIVRAEDMEDARALLAADPAITSGIFVAECVAWRPRFGDVSR